MVCVNPSPPLLRWPSPWSTPEPGQSEAITPAINSCSASLSMQIEGGRRLGKLFTAPCPLPISPSSGAPQSRGSCPDHCQSNVILNLTPFPLSFCSTLLFYEIWPSAINTNQSVDCRKSEASEHYSLLRTNILIAYTLSLVFLGWHSL